MGSFLKIFLTNALSPKKKKKEKERLLTFKGGVLSRFCVQQIKSKKCKYPVPHIGGSWEECFGGKHHADTEDQACNRREGRYDEEFISSEAIGAPKTGFSAAVSSKSSNHSLREEIR